MDSVLQHGTQGHEGGRAMCHSGEITEMLSAINHQHFKGSAHFVQHNFYS